MRYFSSYGPVKRNEHFYVHRTNLINHTYQQLMGNNSSKDGHYITVWAPRQTGKTWIMQEVFDKIKQNDSYEIVFMDMQSAKEIKTDNDILEFFIKKLKKKIGRDLPEIKQWQYLDEIYEKQFFPKPLILILDEFDSLKEEFINKFANVFRTIYISRASQHPMNSNEKDYMLHGLALIGIRSVLGIENITGSPFNIQRSIKIPNFDQNEITFLFNEYTKESGQTIEQDVVQKIYNEFKGQPGLTCWFGELLTEQYNEHPDQYITMKDFRKAYALALHVLPNNNVTNIISKSKVSPYKDRLLELFKTDEIMHFSFDEPVLTYLYMTGIIDYDRQESNEIWVKFQSPFIQKRLFHYFSKDIFNTMGQLMDPFTPIDEIISTDHMDIKALIKLYENYLSKNKDWLFKDVPRRNDLRIYEAVYHFNFYMFLNNIIKSEGQVYPEFPTGNGKVDLFIQYHHKKYAIELKSFSNLRDYNIAIIKAQKYAQQLNLTEISLVFFIDSISDNNREQFEKTIFDEQTGIAVNSIFVAFQ